MHYTMVMCHVKVHPIKESPKPSCLSYALPSHIPAERAEFLCLIPWARKSMVGCGELRQVS
jgi:hypothetical protein